jgi:hypothetical protein
VHELVGLKGKLSDAQQAFLTAYNEGYIALVARRFAEASEFFGRARSLVPEDVNARAWHEQSLAYALQPPLPDWQPFLKLTSK